MQKTPSSARRQSSRQSTGFKFHNFVFNEGKQSFCLEEQDGNKKITVMHWKKTEESSQLGGNHPPKTTTATTSTSNNDSCDSSNFKNSSKSVPLQRIFCDVPNFERYTRQHAKAPEQTQPLDLSTKPGVSTKRREMWSVDEILGLDTPTSSSRLDAASPSSLLASMSCRSPEIRTPTFASTFFPQSTFLGTPPPSPMIDAMLEEEIQCFLRQRSSLFSDQNNNIFDSSHASMESSIEERINSLRKELLDRRISAEPNDSFVRSHFKLTNSGFSSPFSEASATPTRRTVSELDLKSPRTAKQLKRSLEDSATSSLFKTKNDAMLNKLRQLRKYTRNYLDAHRSASWNHLHNAPTLTPTSGSTSSSCQNKPEMQIGDDEDDREDDEEDEDVDVEDVRIKNLWPHAGSNPTSTSASTSTVQSSASASSVDGSI